MPHGITGIIIAEGRVRYKWNHPEKKYKW